MKPSEYKGSLLRELDEETVSLYLEQYLAQEAMSKQVNQRVADMKQTLMAFIEENGIADDKGHLWYEVEDLGNIKRERRSKETLNVERAKEYLDKIGRLKECMKTQVVRVFDEDTFLAILYELELDNDVVDEFYDVNETYAFIPPRRKP